MSDPLFGSGIRMNGAWATHVSAAAETGFLATLRTVPALTRFTLGIAWAADRAALVAAGVAHLVRAVAAAAGLVAVNHALAALLASGRVAAAVPALLVVAALAAGGSCAQALAVAAEGRLAPRVQRLAEERLLDGVARAELAVVEDGAFHRSLAGAQLGVRATEQLTATVLSAAGSLAGVVAVAGVLGALHPLLLPLLLLAVVPQAWRAMTVARLGHASAVRSLNGNRQKQVLADVLVERGAAAEEIRVHGLAGVLLGHYRRLARALEAERARLARVEAGAGLLADAAGGLATALAFAALGWLLVTGRMDLSTAGTSILAVTRVTGLLTSVLLQGNGLYTHGLFVADYQRTVQRVTEHAIVPGTTTAGPAPARIELRDVHFTYPGSDHPALSGVDLTLRPGEVIALVGVNGSGKSTLARLIAGLHRPSRGTVTWNGVDLPRDFSQVAWIAQDFPRWPFTARHNVTLGRPSEAGPGDRLERAAAFAGADTVVAGLPEGWDTLLARDFQGGTDLSGGQWQRLALARAHFRAAQLLICDEPTAALDPEAEVESFTRLMDLARDGQTVVLITHRLGSVRYADRIYVLDAGAVVESGTHDELMARGGRFARMYAAQQRQYAERTP
ncbi:ABC transporter ATP-binding protein [Dactylosporangium sucinum]|uniref:Multidrug ABC transporter permease n=1 Tax=Dactylosporangium sucinum TaxID=1424081 RepID=A0A917X274_9ACTN|nr:ABC transporter ATP-binding protein [Dactylosporangium sucinum]GGM55344.1 multidrug ABC transporter permease [Dactylosporangium sucinum]